MFSPCSSLCPLSPGVFCKELIPLAFNLAPVFEEISDEQNRLNKARKARNRAMKEAGLSLKAEASDSPADDLFSGVYARRPSLPRLQGWTPSVSHLVYPPPHPTFLLTFFSPLQSASTSVPSPSEFGVYPSVLLPMPNVKFYPSVLSSCPSPALSFENSSAHSSPSTDSSPLTPEFDHDSFDTSRHPVDGQRYTSYSQPPPYFNQGHFYPPQPACSFPWLQASFGNPSSPYTPSPNASLGSPFGHLAFQGPNVALNTGLLGITLNEEHAPRGSPAEPLKGLYASSHEEAQVEWSTSWCI